MVSPEQLNPQKPKCFHVCQDCKWPAGVLQLKIRKGRRSGPAFMATMQMRIGSNTEDFHQMNAGLKTHI